MKKIISVPFSLGASKRGACDGAKEILKMINYDSNISLVEEIVTELGECTQDERLKNLDAVVDICRKTKKAVMNTLKDEVRVVVIGGDHSVSLGSIAATSSKFDGDVAVIYLDAHGDINTPETSETGNIHGMTFACAMGIGDKRLTCIADKPIKPSNVLFLGSRSIDSGEQELIRKESIEMITSDEIMNTSIHDILSKIDLFIKDKKVRNIHFSIDIDSLDPQIAPATGVPEPNGLDFNCYINIIKHIIATNKVRTVDFVEYNPCFDTYDKRTKKVCRRTIEEILYV